MILDSPYISGSMSFGIANPSATMHISASTGAVLRVDGAGVTNTGSLFVSSSGNVGIGTAIPVSKLQIEGGALRIGDGAGAWSGFTFSGGLRQTNNNPLTILGELRVDSTAGNPSYISGSGGLGIGKTTANTRLDVNGNTLISGSINATGPITGSSFTTTGTITAQTLIVQTISSSIEFVTGSTRFGSLSTNTHQFTGSMLVSGSLGIGTAPSFPLEISSTSTTLLARFTSNQNEAQIRLVNTSAGGRTYSIGSGGTSSGGARGFYVYDETAGATIFAISGSGNVGIGTSSPNARLSLGTGTTSKLLVYDGGTIAQGGNGFFAGFAVDYPSGNDFGMFAHNNGAIVFGKYTNNNDLNNVTERMRITSGGNVGIGTSSPKTLLQINGGSGAYPTLGTNVTNSIFVGRNDGVIGMYLGYAADGNGWIQQMRNDSATAANLILQPSGGNVGIGTTSPSTVFHVNGSSSRVAIITTSGALSSGFYDAFQMLAANQTGGGLSLNVGKAESTNNLAKMVYFHSSDGSTSNRLGFGFYGADGLVNILASGNVGIGTTSPNARLDLGSSYGASGEKFLVYNDDTSSALAGTKMGFYIDRFSESNSVAFVFPYAPATTSRYHVAYKNTSNTTITDVCYVTYNSTAWTFPSDERLKNIEGIIPNALDKIKDLRAVYYTQKRDPEQKRKVGLLAQDLLKVLPEVVDAPDTELDSDGNQRYMSVALADTIPLLVKAIQELKAEIDELKNK